ncbi:MAG: peptidase [Deltaproteobacteria bacterium HGW-Deltaproteobacteria-18]|jgi:putative proteasome-type protease|nr:MAG: peptidase [Deltaproteobacteria bacterium HGW-Deltaproteobacteria-18]
MTFCLGITVEDGLVGLADTRITAGNEMTTAQKLSTYETQSGAVFFMTSGLRSLRDKVATYFEEALESGPPPDKLYKAVNLFAGLVRRVANEDKEYLDASGLQFNIHTIMGGQFSADATHKLFLIYPQGNWVEITSGTPYHIIGETGYGKPVLDRTLKHEDSIHFALKVGCLAFDSTRISAADVDFPLDVVVYSKGSFSLIEHRFEQGDLAHISTWWQDRLRESVHALPSEWIDAIAASLSPSSRKLHSKTED